jgi:hypothetical protein
MGDRMQQGLARTLCCGDKISESTKLSSLVQELIEDVEQGRAKLASHHSPAIDTEHKTKASARDLAKRELEPLNRNVAEPLSITKLGL